MGFELCKKVYTGRHCIVRVNITEKGRICFNGAIRKAHGINKGDCIRFFYDSKKKYLGVCPCLKTDEGAVRIDSASGINGVVLFSGLGLDIQDYIGKYKPHPMSNHAIKFYINLNEKELQGYLDEKNQALCDSNIKIKALEKELKGVISMLHAERKGLHTCGYENNNPYDNDVDEVPLKIEQKKSKEGASS